MPRRVTNTEHPMSVDRFMAIFDGLEEAYGYFKIEKREASGKNKGKAGIVREPRTKKLWEGHLSGKGIGMGIIPINADNMCNGAVSTLTNTLWTISSCSKRSGV
jgi:hypothetical protein